MQATPTFAAFGACDPVFLSKSTLCHSDAFSLPHTREARDLSRGLTHFAHRSSFDGERATGTLAGRHTVVRSPGGSFRVKNSEIHSRAEYNMRSWDTGLIAV